MIATLFSIELMQQQRIALGVETHRHSAIRAVNDVALEGDTLRLQGLARLIYRLVHGAPPDEPTLQPWEKLVSHATHWAIYALLITVPPT